MSDDLKKEYLSGKMLKSLIDDGREALMAIRHILEHGSLYNENWK
jgi:hypothetical protein